MVQWERRRIFPAGICRLCTAGAEAPGGRRLQTHKEVYPLNEEKKLNGKVLDEVTGGGGTPIIVPSAEEIRAWDDFYTANCGGCTKRTGGCPYNSDPRLIYLTFKGTSGCPFHS